MKPTNFSALPRSRDEARKLGIDRFFTGRPCKHGHAAPRYASTTQCAQCQLEHARKANGWKARPSGGEFFGRLKAIVEGRGGSLISKKYLAARIKLQVRCAKGHEFGATPDNLQRGKWCPACKRVAHSDRQADKLRPVEWLRDFARRKHNGDCLATEPAPMPSLVLWKCSKPNHPPFLSRIRNVIHQGNWCPACDAERRRLHPPKPQIARTVAEQVVAARGGEIVNIADGGAWKGSRTRLTTRCADGHEWQTTVDNLVHAGSWCPNCQHKGERIVRAMFEATFHAPFPKSKPKWMRSAKNRNLELDGFNEDLQLAFEYQGPRHDSDANVKAHDALKRDACARHGVKLIEVQAVKRPFPPENVLEMVRQAFQRYQIADLPVLPSGDIFARELGKLRQLGAEKGGSLLSTRYAGSEPHEWRCGNPDHPPWMAEPWRIRRGAWCPSCARNRPLGIDEFRAWGLTRGIELLNTVYLGTARLYRWRCCAAGHMIHRSKGNIEQSLRKQLPACTVCASKDVRAASARRDEADEFAVKLRPVIDEIRATGTISLTGISKELNRRAVPTFHGRAWYASTVKNLLARLDAKPEDREPL